MSNSEGKACLEQRTTQIGSLIGGAALFQAGAMIKGGQRCADLRTCDHWQDCAGRHGELWTHLTTTLAEVK
ncbi:hypothetical protein A6A04_00930 [Paramagnetospirillum marisnigri]|uniref:Uncharacterized protein n=1 Tax=Paramagnetospirillum marisnigri TaxID=1285242 RepID=A0A178MSD3_9PROT|nr:hypothetical protein [Paramagnetospirillum marisnigri]OAN52290.1 hypothetical protein A6A04_00930 [Paramagnetospirillum marisnigri]